jgi:hypothetical protein
MKSKAILIIGIIFFFISSFGQAKQDLESKTNVFANQSGTLIKKEFEDIGTLKKLEVRVLSLTDLITNESISSVRLELEKSSSYSSDKKIAVLDSDEIESLKTSMEIIKNQIFPSAPKNYTEVTYKSRGGFEAGCFLSKGKWSPYLKLDKYDSDSYLFFDIENLTEFLILLEKAETVINARIK